MPDPILLDKQYPISVTVYFDYGNYPNDGTHTYRGVMYGVARGLTLYEWFFYDQQEGRGTAGELVVTNTWEGSGQYLSSVGPAFDTFEEAEAWGYAQGWPMWERCFPYD